MLDYFLAGHSTLLESPVVGCQPVQHITPINLQYVLFALQFLYRLMKQGITVNKRALEELLAGFCYVWTVPGSLFPVLMLR